MEILKVEGVSKQIKNRKILDNINFSIFECEYPSDDPIQQVDINNVNISSSIALSKDGAIYELQTK